MPAADEIAVDSAILVPEQQNAARFLTIAAGTPSLLVVRRRRTGDRIVHDEPDVRLVDPHTERVGGNDRLELASHERFLRLTAFTRSEPPCIPGHVEACGLELG